MEADRDGRNLCDFNGHDRTVARGRLTGMNESVWKLCDFSGQHDGTTHDTAQRLKAAQGLNGSKFELFYKTIYRHDVICFPCLGVY